MAIRIGYVVAEFPSVTETFVANEIQGLLDCGASVTVFALREGEGDNVPICPVFYRGQAQNVSVGARWSGFRRALREAVVLEWPSLPVMLQAARSSWAAVDFAALVKQNDIQHVHAHFAFVPTDVALMIRRLAGVTVSFSAHAWDVFCRGHALAAKLRVSRLCVTCTDAAYRHISSQVEEQERAKIVRIYHGTDLRRFALQPHGQMSDPPRILAVGRLVPKKGFETLLYACRRLRERTPFRCDIIGQGPLERSLKRHVEDLKLGDLVNFYGTVPYGAMPEIYERTDVLAVPSVQAPDSDRDGLPNVVVEAMASGVPVVASRISGIPEAVEDEQSGLLCPPAESAALANALHRMLTDSELRSRCTAKARQVVEEKFDAAKNARLLMERFEAIVEGHAGW